MEIRPSAAPQQVRETREFLALCPDTAQVMAKDIRGQAHYYPKEMLQLRPDVPGAAMWSVALDLPAHAVEAWSRVPQKYR